MITLSTAATLFTGGPKMTIFEAIKAAKKAGFDYLDMSFFAYCRNDGEMAKENWRDWICQVKECADQNGIRFRQTHGNFVLGLQWDDPAFPEGKDLLALNTRCAEASKILGAEWMVVHPMNLPRQPVYNRGVNKAANLAYLAPVIEKAKEVGIGIAVENMVDFSRNMRRYCGGDPEELLDLVDTINDPAVGICLDTGHACLTSIHVPSYIRLAGDRLKALHINDNRQKGDEHLLPFDGLVDWQGVAQALRDIGYDHDYSFEVRSRAIPKAAQESWFKYVHDLGEALINL